MPRSFFPACPVLPGAHSPIFPPLPVLSPRGAARIFQEMPWLKISSSLSAGGCCSLLVITGRCPGCSINASREGQALASLVMRYGTPGQLSNQHPINSGQGWACLSSLSLSEMLCINIPYIKKKNLIIIFSSLKETVWNWNRDKHKPGEPAVEGESLRKVFW